MESSAVENPRSDGQLSKLYPSAFVTGGSSGLGRVFVESLHRGGVEVWAGSRSAERLTGLPEGVHPAILDLSEREAVEDFLDDPPWRSTPALLFNNAGFGEFGKIAGIQAIDLSRQVQAMLESSMLLCRHFLASESSGMDRRVGVVNVSSLAVEFPLPFLHGYNAVKAGLSGFSRSLALEYPGGTDQPFVIDLRPGDFRTAFNRAVRREQGGSDASLATVWEALERHLDDGADPQSIWPPLQRALYSGKSRTLRVGTVFQARIAPFLARMLPERLVMWGHRRYYKLDCG